MEATNASQSRDAVSTLRDPRELSIDSGITTSSGLAEDLGVQDAGNKSMNHLQGLHARKASTSEKSKKQFGGIGLGGPSTYASRSVAANGSFSIPQGQAGRDGKAFAEDGSRNPMHRQTPSLSLSGRMPSARRASIASHSPTSSPPYPYSPSFSQPSRSSYNSKFKQIQSQTLSGRLFNYLSRYSPRQIALRVMFLGLAIFFIASLFGHGSSRSGSLPHVKANPVHKGQLHNVAKGEYEGLSGEDYAQQLIIAEGQDVGRSAGRGRPARIPKEPFQGELLHKEATAAATEFAEVDSKKLPPLAMRKQRLSPAQAVRQGSVSNDESKRPGDTNEMDAVADRAVDGGIAGSEADMFERNLALNRAKQQQQV